MDKNIPSRSIYLGWVGPHLKDHWPASGSCDVKLEARITKVKHWHEHLNGVVATVENLLRDCKSYTPSWEYPQTKTLYSQAV